uniref:DNA polymerase III alpha subunit n=1 Tax=Pithovirus LCPAC302 TaxID=2506593 RepID=A0A481Z6M5_9VIRU|nr:MAG: DNA polymerase III alpha subunit [Pithovirus LCPAC302]
MEYGYLYSIDSIQAIQNVYIIIKLANKKPALPYFVRGSANSSVLCYLLGISHIDPIKYGVVLARFLNSTRKDLPDVDIDFPSHLRDEMFRRIQKQFLGRVARISNKVCFRERSSVRQAMRNMLIHRFFGKNEDPFDILSPDVKNKVAYEACKLNGKLNYYSLHCGGILIYPEKIPSNIVLKTDKKIKDEIMPQVIYDKYDVDRLGLFKIDILSNRAFSTLLHIDSRPLCKYPESDHETSKILSTSVIGITLAESSLIGSICKKYSPKTRYELALVLSLARPASSSTRRLKKDDLKMLDSSDDILIFDDDAIEYISKLTGMSHDLADRYRKYFAKNNKDGKSKFIKILQKRGYGNSKVKLIVRKLNTLRLYGFCKGHALAFAHLVWGLAYSKAHYPSRFWLAALNYSNTEWRKWVYYRSAITEGGLNIDLAHPGKDKWRLKGNRLIKGGRQKTLTEYFNKTTDMNYRKAYLEYGYWTDSNFLSDMYLHKMEKDGKILVRFIGLIGRVKYSSIRDYITIGYDNNKYIDCSVRIGEKRTFYDEYDIIDGYGTLQNNTVIHVTCVDYIKL